jgi:hypothetical protein
MQGLSRISVRTDASVYGLTYQSVSLQTAMHAIQHSERYWKDPMEFRPERMLDPLGISTPAFAPFGEVALSSHDVSHDAVSCFWSEFVLAGIFNRLSRV